MTDHSGDYQPLVDAVLERCRPTEDPDFIAYEVRKWADRIVEAGFNIVPTADLFGRNDLPKP